MKILAIETSSDACSAALYIDGDIFERFELAPRQHTKLLLPMVEAVMAEAQCNVTQLDAVAFGRGPGAFTGVRVATAAAQGIAFSADIPVAAISTLQAIAQEAHEQEGHENLLVAVDARMGELYWGAYEIKHNHPELIDKELICKPEKIPSYEKNKWCCIGSGWSEYNSYFASQLNNNYTLSNKVYFPRAANIAKLAVNTIEHGELVSAEQAQPVYLRDKVV